MTASAFEVEKPTSARSDAGIGERVAMTTRIRRPARANASPKTQPMQGQRRSAVSSTSTSGRSRVPRSVHGSACVVVNGRSWAVMASAVVGRCSPEPQTTRSPASSASQVNILRRGDLPSPASPRSTRTCGSFSLAASRFASSLSSAFRPTKCLRARSRIDKGSERSNGCNLTPPQSGWSTIPLWLKFALRALCTLGGRASSPVTVSRTPVRSELGL